jgi:uncharacterized membrane protein
MESVRNEKQIYRAFELTIILKGLHGIIEILGGLLFLVISKDFVLTVAMRLTEDELADDPNDFVANFLLHSAQNFMHSKTFAALFLISHGLLNCGLAWGLLRNKMWAYPAALVALTYFIIYQAYRLIAYPFSLTLFGFTIFDLVVIWLIAHEYRIARAARAHSGEKSTG